MQPGRYDFIILDGADTIRYITWKNSDGDPINLTPYSAIIRFKKFIDDDTIALNLEDGGGGITLGGSTGLITLQITPAQAELLTAKSYIYQLELSAGGTTIRALQGFVTKSRRV